MGDADRLPPRLWWVLAGLTFAWGFNWSAMKIALHEVTPWVFRSLCLGFPLARLEGQVALPAVLARWKRISLANDQPLQWIDSMVLRGVQSMPLRVERG